MICKREVLLRSDETAKTWGILPDVFLIDHAPAENRRNLPFLVLSVPFPNCEVSGFVLLHIPSMMKCLVKGPNN